MADFLYGGILVADATTFQRATNALCTVYDVNDTANTTPLALKDPNGLPVPNPVTSTSDAFIPPMIAPSEGVKIVGGGLTVVVYSHIGIKNEAVAARAAAEEAAVQAEAAAQLVGAPADTAIAAAVNGNGATKAALSATILDKVTTESIPRWKANTAYTAGQVVLNPSGDKVSAKTSFTSGATYSAANWNTRSTFHQPPSGGSAGISSYRVDNNGNWVSGQVVVKSDTDNANRSVIDWSNVDPGTGYLLHLVAGSNMGGGLIGLGADGDTGTALVVSCKGAMTGVGITNTATSTGVGFAAGNFGTGLLMKIEKGNAGAGTLLSLRGFSGGTSGIFKWRNAADTADLGLIEDGGAFNLYGAAGHRSRWDHGSGYDQRIYTFSGTAGQFWTTAFKASTNTFQIQAGQSAAHAQGAETLTTLVEVKSGARLGFYGATPVTKPALTYSRTGETAAAAALRTALASLGLVTDSTTA